MLLHRLMASRSPGVGAILFGRGVASWDGRLTRAFRFVKGVPMPNQADQLTGKYHPDPEINEGVAADALEGEEANLAAGFDPSPWECGCGAAHARGYFQTLGVHRCLRCGYVGVGGRLMDPEEFERYRTPNYEGEPVADKVERFDMQPGNFMLFAGEGRWVRYFDYETLETERARLTCVAAEAEADRLRAEMERDQAEKQRDHANEALEEAEQRAAKYKTLACEYRQEITSMEEESGGN